MMHTIPHGGAGGLTQRGVLHISRPDAPAPFCGQVSGRCRCAPCRTASSTHSSTSVLSAFVLTRRLHKQAAHASRGIGYVPYACVCVSLCACCAEPQGGRVLYVSRWLSLSVCCSCHTHLHSSLRRVSCSGVSRCPSCKQARLHGNPVDTSRGQGAG